MDASWALRLCLLELLCLPGAASSQPPSRRGPSHLLWAPDRLHPGRPTNVGVTVLTPSPVQLTACLALGGSQLCSASIVTPGGLPVTTILTLPAVDSVSLGPQVMLEVRGLQPQKEVWVFSNSTWLAVSRGSASSSVQTGRSRYRPGDRVQIRVASLELDNRPHAGPVDLEVLDPDGNVIQRWESQGSDLGIVSKELVLPLGAVLGRWSVVTTTDGLPSDKTFLVENSAPPPFDLLLKTAPEILLGADLVGVVQAQSPGGQTVHGTLSVNVSHRSPSAAPGQPFLTLNKEIRGAAQFSFSRNALESIHGASEEDMTLDIKASITETSSGFTVKRLVGVRVLLNMFKLQFRDVPRELKPSLSFSAKLEVFRFDGMPLTPPIDRKSVSLVVRQKTSSASEHSESTTLPLVGGAAVLLQFPLQADIQELLIHATFMSSTKTLRVFSKRSSASGSYLQIKPSSLLPAQIGSPHELSIEATFPAVDLHYVVRSRGQVVAAGTLLGSSSLSLTPVASWFPAVCVSVFGVLADGEVVSDALLLAIQQPHRVSVAWNQAVLRPGAAASLTVAVQSPGAQVLVLVTGGAPEARLPLQERLADAETGCGAVEWGDGQRLGPGPEGPGGPGGGDQAWSHWTDQGSPVTWLYLSANVSGASWVSPPLSPPGGAGSWRVEVLVMSAQGFSVSTATQRLSVARGELALSADLPGSVVRGEEVVLEISVSNRRPWDVQVVVLLEHSQAFEFVLGVEDDVSVINARTVTVQGGAGASVLFPIRPLLLGPLEISSAAVSAEASDRLELSLRVEPEGVARTFSQTHLLELAPNSHSDSRTFFYSFPPDVVAGSQRVHVAVVGDILALSVGGLGSLVGLPQGCGEQNMVPFAPSVSILRYLEVYNHPSIRARALAMLAEGYQRELSYRRGDGSFGAFQDADTPGSTWLTAFVLRSFFQAQSFMAVDQDVLSQAASWLVSNQGRSGVFREAGAVLHTQMRRRPAALTAFVLMALLQDPGYAVLYESSIARAAAYLEGVALGAAGNYTLSLMAYALALRSPASAIPVLEELGRRAAFTDGERWRASGAATGPEGASPASSAEVEVVSYVLLALSLMDFVKGYPLMRWLTQQRTHLGGYASTQDTVVALEALSVYASVSGANLINVRVGLTSSTMAAAPSFTINSTNHQLYQGAEIDAEQNVTIELNMEGFGFAHFQMNVFYNTQTAVGEEDFLLEVRALDDGRDLDHMVVSVCTGLLGLDPTRQTGMVLVDVSLLSGFVLVPGSAALVGPVRMVETPPGRVVLYLDSLTPQRVCFGLPLVRRHRVARVKDAAVRVYDYYEPGRGAMRTYNSDLLKVLDSCGLCGQDCGLCRSGVSLASAHPVTSDPSVPYCLACLGAVITWLLL